MATRIRPSDRHTTIGQHPGMERSIAISRPTVGSDRLYTSCLPGTSLAYWLPVTR